jgi:hypothetical protein
MPTATPTSSPPLAADGEKPNDPRAIASAGARHLANLVQPDGRFIYHYGRDRRAKPGYNLLRHCGTAWAMADVAKHLDGHEAVMEAARFAMVWLLGKRTKEAPSDFSLAGRTVVGKGGFAKTGGAALAALACLALAHNAHGKELDPDWVAQAESFGDYLLSVRREAGDFVDKIHLETGADTGFRSEYYTGEALFALAQIYEATGNERWIGPVVDSLHKLGARDYGVEEQVHWMLYALDAAGRLSEPEPFVDYAGRIARSIFDAPFYRMRMESCPIACRSEGLLAFLRLTEKASGYGVSELRREAYRTVRENLDLQRRFFRPSGAFVRGAGKEDVRIDFVQHNISSFLHFDTLNRRQPLLAATI